MKNNNNNKEKEIRTLGTIQLRAMEDGSESRTVEGYAVVFDSDSEDMGFIEQISTGAITDETIRHSDVMALLDHNPDRGILARSYYGRGSLKLELDEKGLKYTFDAPNTPLGDEVLEMIRRGDIFGSSFAFTIEDEEWKYDGDKALRFVKKIDRLYDVSPVYSPAYMATSATTRKLDEINAINEKLNSYLNIFSETIE